MFEELCRLAGTISIPDGTYTDGKPNYTTLNIKYFSQDTAYREPQTGALKMQTYFMCKPLDTETNIPEKIPANSKFTDSAGELFDIGTSERVFNHFDNTLEFFKLTVV